ncbi:MAG: hypothetical protein WCK02_07625 [Bacteroidota bacterium]
MQVVQVVVGMLYLSYNPVNSLVVAKSAILLQVQAVVSNPTVSLYLQENGSTLVR